MLVQTKNYLRNLNTPGKTVEAESRGGQRVVLMTVLRATQASWPLRQSDSRRCIT
jgi:hypothetical protein